MKIKPKSETSCHITLLSVISGLFYARYLHCSSLYLGLATHGIKLAVKLSRDSSTVPVDILAAASWLGFTKESIKLVS